MILGNEMQQIQSAIMREARSEIQKESTNNGKLEQAVCEALQLGVFRYVYSVYSPTIYGRRMDSGGLTDVNNYMTVYKATATG